jgi:hypothetical protein
LRVSLSLLGGLARALNSSVCSDWASQKDPKRFHMEAKSNN